MKVAIPSETGEGLTSIRSGHFGHTPWFTLVTIEDGQVTGVESVKNVDHDEVGCGGVIEFAHNLGIDAMICAGMGQPPPMVGDVVNKFIAGDCARMVLENACSHHH